MYMYLYLYVLETETILVNSKRNEEFSFFAVKNDGNFYVGRR